MMAKADGTNFYFDLNSQQNDLLKIIGSTIIITLAKKDEKGNN